MWLFGVRQCFANQIHVKSAVLVLSKWRKWFFVLNKKKTANLHLMIHNSLCFLAAKVLLSTLRLPLEVSALNLIFLCVSCFAVQLNQRDAHVSTTARSTKTVRASVPAVNTSAPASTEPLAALPSAATSCHRLPRPAPTHVWSGYRDSAASVSTATKTPGFSHLSIRFVVSVVKTQIMYSHTQPQRKINHLSSLQQVPSLPQHHAVLQQPQHEPVLANILPNTKSRNWGSERVFENLPGEFDFFWKKEVLYLDLNFAEHNRKYI